MRDREHDDDETLQHTASRSGRLYSGQPADFTRPGHSRNPAAYGRTREWGFGGLPAGERPTQRPTGPTPGPGGAVLARHLLDRPEVVAGRRVVDLGAGSGLVAIAAAKAGAAAVTAVDVDANAIAAIGLNAAVNGVNILVVTADIIEAPPPEETDILVVGDLFYDPALALRVMAFLRRCQASGIEVLIGDPHRAYLPQKELQRIATHAVPDFGGGRGGDPVQAGVFSLVSNS